MGDRLDLHLLHEGQDALYIDTGGGQQGLSQRPAAQGLHRRLQVSVLHIQDLPDQGKAVGMNPRGGQAQNHISGLDGGFVKHLRLIHHTHRKSGQIILIHRIEARHLGGFPADERYPGLHASLGHAGDNVRNLLRDILAAGNIVQEEKGLGPHANNIVDTHSHTVDAHCVMFVHQKRQLQLGSHPIGAGDQNRTGNPRQVQFKQAAKSTDVRQGARRHGLGDVGFHELHGPIASGNVHARCGVTVRS